MPIELKVMKLDKGSSTRHREKFGTAISRSSSNEAVEGYLYIDPTMVNLTGVVGFRLDPIYAHESSRKQ